MPLADSRIKEIGSGILDPYQEENVKSICYDLHTMGFSISAGQELKEMDLMPGHSVFVSCVECIQLPDNLCAEIHLRNSRLRQGLSLDAPIYQPGHECRLFFRITNVSKQAIHLDTGEGIASVYFYSVEGNVDHPYAGEFQDEKFFTGLGKYSSRLLPDIKDVDSKFDAIKNISGASTDLSHHVYHKTTSQRYNQTY